MNVCAIMSRRVSVVLSGEISDYFEEIRFFTSIINGPYLTFSINDLIKGCLAYTFHSVRDGRVLKSISSKIMKERGVKQGGDGNIYSNEYGDPGMDFPYDEGAPTKVHDANKRKYIAVIDDKFCKVIDNMKIILARDTPIIPETVRDSDIIRYSYEYAYEVENRKPKSLASFSYTVLWASLFNLEPAYAVAIITDKDLFGKIKDKSVVDYLGYILKNKNNYIDYIQRRVKLPHYWENITISKNIGRLNEIDKLFISLLAMDIVRYKDAPVYAMVAIILNVKINDDNIKKVIQALEEDINIFFDAMEKGIE